MRKCCNWVYNIYAIGLAGLFAIVLILWCYLVFLVTALWNAGELRHRAFYYMCRKLTALLFFLLGIRVREYAKEWKNRQSPAIFIANHTSYLDSLLILLITNSEVYPLGKSEIGKIPIIGFLYKLYVVPLDRGKLSSKKHSFAQMQNLLAQGKSVFIFPEGGFKDEPELRLEPFTTGVFRLASEFQIPIYPMLFVNTRKCFQLYSGRLQIRPGTVKIQYLPALYPPANLEPRGVQDFRDQAFWQMYEALSSYAYPL